MNHESIKKMRARFENFGISFFSRFFRRLPLPAARFSGDVTAALISHLTKIRRRVALENLHHAFPQKSIEELEKLYHGCWRHFVRLGVEMARMPRLNEPLIQRWIHYRNLDVFDRALKKGKGIIVVSGHFGNWEWMGAGIANLGYPATYVVTSQTNEFAEKWLNDMREAVGVEIIHRRNAAKGVLRALKNNRIIAILCDQNAGRSGVFVPFFNRLASTPRGPAVFHLKTGAPLVFVSAPRMADDSYEVTFEVMEFDDLTGNFEEDERRIMAKITARLEQEVRKYPDQWLWLHRRWKTQPEKPEKSASGKS